MADQTQFHSTDSESQANQSAYHNLLASIERKDDPRSNTVLIVDDSKLVRMKVKKSLTEKDSKVVIYEAADGVEALVRLAEIREKYDRDPLFIVTDLEMPNMNGWEFIDRLQKDYESRGLPQGIPLIVLSASSGEKGSLFFKKSVHGGKAHYNPMVTVAKADCLKPGKYDTQGEKGISAWMKHFLKSGTSYG